ncbi:MAG: winged helix-turn-helix transcriptional regulator [Cyanobacteria bacterium P01_A01_bin.37]
MGLLERKVISTKPIAVAYKITGFGCTALGVLEELEKWSEARDI